MVFRKGIAAAGAKSERCRSMGRYRARAGGRFGVGDERRLFGINRISTLRVKPALIGIDPDRESIKSILIVAYLGWGSS